MGTDETERDDSLAPVAVDRLSVEEEVALMDKGKVGQVLAALGALACIVAAGVFWLKGMDEAKAYEDLATATATLQHDQMSAFVHCALPGVHASRIETGEQLGSAIEQASLRLPTRYASMLRRCARRIGSVDQSLSTLPAPADMAADVDGLRAASRALSAAVLGFSDALDELEPRADTRPSGAVIAHAWDAFIDQRSSLEARAKRRI